MCCRGDVTYFWYLRVILVIVLTDSDGAQVLKRVWSVRRVHKDSRTIEMARGTATRKSHSLNGLGHSLLWPLLFLLFVGWIVELVGLAGLQHRCDSDYFTSTPIYATATQLPSGLACSAPLACVF